MIVGGIDTASLPDSFNNCISGRTLILDGDGPAYVAAATCKRLDTAIRRFQTSVLADMFMTKSQSAAIHFTASGCAKNNRFKCLGVKPYQGNRKDKAKPALLEPLREAMALRDNWLPEFDYVRLHKELEADDGMMIDAYRLKNTGVIKSEDKDLRMTPYLYYEHKTGTVKAGQEVGHVRLEFTQSGVPKCLGQGPLFFWAQMIMGDTADNVAGLAYLNGKKCGPAAAFGALENVEDINDAANLVISGYRAIDQNPLPEAWMLWLLRWDTDHVWQYLSELELTRDNRAYLERCSQRVWFDRG